MKLFQQEPYTEEGKVSAEMQHYLEELLVSDYTFLKKFYGNYHPGISGLGGVQFLINVEEVTTNINMSEEPSKECFENPTEQFFYSFYLFLNRWVECRYQHWMTSLRS